MRRPRSLQARLALSLGVLLTLLWIAAASVTAIILRQEMNAVFDAALQETAQRLLPLAVVDIVGREDDGVTQRLGSIRAHDESFTYIVRDARGRILVQSHAADPAVFPAWDGPGFGRTATHRLYSEEALQGSIRITLAEPLEHRATVAREIQMGLGLPLLVVIPLAFLAIALAVRASLAPLRRFRNGLAARHARDLSPVPAEDLPSEIAPMASTLNSLLGRLRAAFDAERSFAANAAHELRTPLAGAIAQAQRLRSETRDPDAARRGAEIEEALKRLTRLSEKMLQLARAEGGRLRTGDPKDLRPVLSLVVSDFARSAGTDRFDLEISTAAVLSDLDPDTFGILCRNLIENALRHGTPGAVIRIGLTANGLLSVANECPAIAPETLARLTSRFERGSGAGGGSGLGLTIVQTIAERADCAFTLFSPAGGQETGFEARLDVSGGIARPPPRNLS
jgi:two-component system OmpR family sensor kinase